MSYDYDRLFKKIIAAVTASGSGTERMHAVIDECTLQKPHRDWEQMRSIQYDADSPRIAQWFSKALSKRKAKPEPQGLWFGLFNPTVAGKPSADIYACVAPTYEADSIEWACGIEPPRPGSYLRSAVLREIYSRAYESDGGLGNAAEYPLVLAYGGIVAHSALSEYPLPPELRSLHGAAVGFDSGDFLVLGEFNEGKYRAQVRAG